MFTKHVDKHGECKSVLASKSGKFNEERMADIISRHIITIRSWVCCLFYLLCIPEPAC